MAETAITTKLEDAGTGTDNLPESVGPPPVVPEEMLALEELMKKPTKTAEEVVDEIMSQVSDEGIQKAFARSQQLTDELGEKIQTMQSSFNEKMADIQADMEKYWAVDEEMKKNQEEMHRILNEPDDGLNTEELKKMIDNFKAGNWKEAKMGFRKMHQEQKSLEEKKVQNAANNNNNNVNGVPNGQDVLNNNNNGSPDVSLGEDAFEDACSTTSESSTVSVDTQDGRKGSVDKTKSAGKSPRTSKKSEDGSKVKKSSSTKKSSKEKPLKS